MAIILARKINLKAEMEIFPQVLSEIKHPADTRAAPHLPDICISNKSGVRVINLNKVYLFIIHHNYS